MGTIPPQSCVVQPVVYLLSTNDHRCQALARLLKDGGCRNPVVRVRLTGDPKTWTHGILDRILRKHDLEPTKSGDIVVPTGAADTEWFLGHADCRVGEIVHSRASLRVFDKRWLLAEAARAHIPIPVTWTSADDIGVDDFPVFYKDSYERESGIRGLARQARDLPILPAGQLIFQECIVSPGTYGVGFLARDGEVLVSYSHYESSSNPSTGGVGVIFEPCPDERLLEHTDRLVGHLGYSGWGLAEFKYCLRRKDYVLMEINAKFWGSCELAFRNEPKFLRSLFGVETESQEIERMTILNHALARGPRYVVRHRHELINSRRILYRGWGRSLVVGLLPQTVKKYLRKVRSAARTGLGRSQSADHAINRRPTT
jgi:hypothetical protein